MSRSFVIALAMTFYSFSSAGAASPASKTCFDPDVRQITRSLFPDRPGSRTFQLKFRYHPAAVGKPTLVYLPGGPGESAINGSAVPMTIPEGFGLIETDPRGVGCNQLIGAAPPDAAFTTEQLASDALAVVKALKIDHYILHGISYGTMVATVAAGLAEKSGQRPAAVILEGVIGRAFKPGEVSQTFTEQWRETMKKRLPADLVAAFKSGNPLGLSSSDWGRTVSSLLILGVLPPLKTEMLPALLRGASIAATDSEKAALKDLVMATAHPLVDASAEKLFNIIACHEIASEVTSFAFNADFTLERGELKAVPGHLCDGVVMDRPFDAAQWKTTAPVYYFEGSRDAATPMFQALYNYNAQTLSKRTFVTVDGGSHPALTLNLADCRPAILEEIGNGGFKLSDALGKCALATTVR